MTPLKDDDSSEVGCYDKDGFLTKTIGNQQTCFFAFAIKDDSVYSGPLIYSKLSNFGPNIGIVTFWDEPLCYTSVKNTTFNRNDSCIYIPSDSFDSVIYNPSDSVFICCCSKEHKNCKIQKEKLYCAPRVLSNTSYESFYFDGLLFEYKRMPMQKYLNESVNYACGIKISTKVVTFQSIFYDYKRPKFEVEYISLNSCSDETTIDISESGFCSSKAEKPENMSVLQCCKSGNFCNLNLTSIKHGEMKFNKCAFKPDISSYFDEPNTCELYRDLNQRRIYHHENFTTKIVHRTWYYNRTINEEKPKPHNISYQCYYIYAEIINVDSQNCSEQIYNEFGSIKPFYYCTCQDFNCDDENFVTLVPDDKFICQHLVKTDFENAKNSVENFAEKGKWICYVQIDFYFEGSK
uniref:Uncharacterized protein n=1 Tax=Panagrolaimus sp. PS1159 TaxID=55785 RepID=A0AC35ETL4_9BILA